jgi:hypothetical protein
MMIEVNTKANGNIDIPKFLKAAAPRKKVIHRGDHNDHPEITRVNTAPDCDICPSIQEAIKEKYNLKYAEYEKDFENLKSHEHHSHVSVTIII